MKRLVAARRLSQAFFLIFFVYILWSTTYPLTGLVSPGVLFKIDPLIMIMTSLSERIILPGITLSIIMIGLTAIFGRFFCGWVCPLGTAIDAAGVLRKDRKQVSDNRNASIRSVKFYIVGLVFIAALFARQIAWIFDPIVVAGRFVSLNLIPAVTALINSFFIFLIRDLHAGEGVKDLYHALKPLFLGVKTSYFSHAVPILAFFLIICSAALLVSRLWCRMLCPLGAIYAFIAKIAPLRRVVEDCSKCGICKSRCRMGAIKDDLSYDQGECILCMDCVYDCPDRVTAFRFHRSIRTSRAPEAKKEGSGQISRRNFLIILVGAFSALGASFGGEHGVGRKNNSLIRPPGALVEDDFVNRCVRCGNCMKVCPTNALHPIMFQGGIDAVWTPQLIPEIGYCEYQCTQCGRTCPTGALPVLTREQKMKTKLGTAEVDRSLCLPWAEGKECIVCQEHCPVAEKAIKLDSYAGGPARPHVDEYLCVGCGICQNKCPVSPARAIRLTDKDADRTAVL